MTFDVSNRPPVVVAPGRSRDAPLIDPPIFLTEERKNNVESLLWRGHFLACRRLTPATQYAHWL